ncbi:MAG: SDR family oxidoreductase [Planctomycetota bacterium]|nr:SDR family oxidoreductase [Planctomycetota bacterium]
MKRDLHGKVIIITGASSGIGAVTALRCAEAGMDVVLSARREDRLREVVRRTENAGRRAVPVVGDVAEPGMSDRLLDAARAEFGRFDAVFSNAGYGMNKTVLDTTDEEWRRMFDVNFFAGVKLLRAAAQRLIDEGRPGHLLMCSSCLSKFSLPRHAAYAATKAAQNMLCSAMRHELRPRGIYVSSVHPITTTTEFFEASARISGRPRDKVKMPDHTPKFMIQRPERVARAVVRCLRRPCPEVWTSLLVRTVAGVMTLSPRFYDWAIRRETAAELRAESN